MTEDTWRYIEFIFRNSIDFNAKHVWNDTVPLLYWSDSCLSQTKVIITKRANEL